MEGVLFCFCDVRMPLYRAVSSGWERAFEAVGIRNIIFSQAELVQKIRFLRMLAHRKFILGLLYFSIARLSKYLDQKGGPKFTLGYQG